MNAVVVFVLWIKLNGAEVLLQRFITLATFRKQYALIIEVLNNFARTRIVTRESATVFRKVVAEKFFHDLKLEIRLFLT